MNGSILDRPRQFLTFFNYICTGVEQVWRKNELLSCSHLHHNPPDFFYQLLQQLLVVRDLMLRLSGSNVLEIHVPHDAPQFMMRVHIHIGLSVFLKVGSHIAHMVPESSPNNGGIHYRSFGDAINM